MQAKLTELDQLDQLDQPQPSAVISDTRLMDVMEIAHDITGLSKVLENNLTTKLDNLLGPHPMEATDSVKLEEPNCWAEQLLQEQRKTRDFIRSALDRLSAL